MKRLSLLLLLAALPAYAQTEVTGTAHVIDGTTIHVNSASGTTTVKLQAIAAPDFDQPGGKEAAAFLSERAENKPVRCVLSAPIMSSREIWVCYVDGQDIAGAEVRAGLARDCPAFSGARYRDIERPEAMKLQLPDNCTSVK